MYNQQMWFFCSLQAAQNQNQERSLRQFHRMAFLTYMHLASETFNATMEILVHSNSTLNDSLLANANAILIRVGRNPYEEFHKAAFGFAIFIIVGASISILANGLLFVFYVNPLEIFCNPITYFLVGWAIVDLLTALVHEPIFATCFMLLHFQHPASMKRALFMRIGAQIGGFTMTISLLIVFAFTLTQYISWFHCL